MAGYLALKSLSLRDRRWTRPPLFDRLGAEAVELQFVPPQGTLGQVFGAQQEHRFDELDFDLAVRHPGTSLPQSPGLVLDFAPAPRSSIGSGIPRERGAVVDLGRYARLAAVSRLLRVARRWAPARE